MKRMPIALVALGALIATAQAQQNWTEIDDDNFVVEALGMTIEELDDADVYDMYGERIGELDDVLISLDGTSSIAISLDVGGFLGLGEKDVVIAAEDLTATANGLTLDMTKEQLEALPAHDG